LIVYLYTCMKVKIPKEVLLGISRRDWTGGQQIKCNRCAPAPPILIDSIVIYLYGGKNSRRGVARDQEERLDRRAVNQIGLVCSITTDFI
jgi:hypothetical protein